MSTPSSQSYEQAARIAAEKPLFLRLYLSGNNPRSHNTLLRVRQFLEQRLPGKYQLEVVDVSQQRHLARSEQIVATPTLVKYIPQPKKIWVGDLTNTDRILAGLGLPVA
jgi:circadian clock protein KaiB